MYSVKVLVVVLFLNNKADLGDQAAAQDRPVTFVVLIQGMGMGEMVETMVEVVEMENVMDDLVWVEAAEGELFVSSGRAKPVHFHQHV